MIIAEYLTGAFKGNREALRIAQALWDITQVWDDIIDGDTPYSDVQVNKAFMDALITVGASPLWTPRIAGVFSSVFYRWNTANKYESTPNVSTEALTQAWMLRAGLYDVFIALADELYGVEWAMKIGPEIHSLYGEPLQAYLEEMKNA